MASVFSKPYKFFPILCIPSPQIRGDRFCEGTVNRPWMSRDLMFKCDENHSGFCANSHIKPLTIGMSWCITRAHEADPSQSPISVVCRCKYIGGVVVVVGVYIYIKRVRRARARAYTPPGAWLSSRVTQKGQKKTLEHSPTLPTAHKSCGNQKISDTP